MVASSELVRLELFKMSLFKKLAVLDENILGCHHIVPFWNHLEGVFIAYFRFGLAQD